MSGHLSSKPESTLPYCHPTLSAARMFPIVLEEWAEEAIQIFEKMVREGRWEELHEAFNIMVEEQNEN